MVLHGFNPNSPSIYPASACIKVENCQNIRLSGIAIDMNVLPYSTGTITDKGPGYFEVQFFPQYEASSAMKVEGILSHTSNGEISGKNCDSYYPGGAVQLQSTSTLKKLRFLTGLCSSLQVGEWISIRHQIYGQNGIACIDSSGIEIDSVDIYSSAGMGIVFAGCDRVTVTGSSVRRRQDSHRPISTNADALHIVNGRGRYTISECTFNWMGDDGINIHNYNGQIVAESTSSSSVVFVPKSGHWHNVYKGGDTIQFRHPGTMELVHETFLLQDPTQSGQNLNMILGSLPASTLLGTIACVCTGPSSVSIDGAVIHNNRARGMVLQSANTTVVNSNIRRTTGPAVLVTSDAFFFYESRPASNLTIADCTFEANNLGAVSGNAAVCCTAPVGSPPGGEMLGGNGVHQDIAIHRNLITNQPRGAIYVSSSSMLTISRNQMLNLSSGIGIPPKSQYALLLERVNGAVISNNLLSGQYVMSFGQTESQNISLINNIGF